VLNFDFEFGIEVINEARRKKLEEDLYQRWIIGGYEKEMKFSDFKKQLMDDAPKHPSKDITEAEIFAKVRKILEMRRE